MTNREVPATTIQRRVVYSQQNTEEFHYYGECTISDLSSTPGAAGAWDLVVSLNGEIINTQQLDMWCLENYL